jgi:transposase
MSQSYTPEFRQNAVALARQSDTSVAQVAKDLGIPAQTLHRWLAAAAVEDGVKPGVTRAESVELRELRKRNRVLEQEVEILKRAAAYFAKANNILPK